MRGYLHVSSALGEEVNPVSPGSVESSYLRSARQQISNPRGKMFSHSKQKNVLKAGIFAFWGIMGNNDCDSIQTCFLYFE